MNKVKGSRNCIGRSASLGQATKNQRNNVQTNRLEITWDRSSLIVTAVYVQALDVTKEKNTVNGI